MQTARLFRLAALLFTGLLVSLTIQAQNDPASRPSPPATASGMVKGASITINYSSPAVKGREIWGGLVPYGEVWRAGANEATTFETDKAIKIKGQVLPAGKYGFFVLPAGKKWTVIFNKVPDQWGAYNYESSQDALRAVVNVKKSPVMNERLKYEVTKKGFSLSWENRVLRVPVK